MRMVLHELIRMDLNVVFVFVLKEQAVIEPFCPILAEEPVAIMALPGDVE